jgi:Rieske Fe-S protein
MARWSVSVEHAPMSTPKTKSEPPCLREDGQSRRTLLWVGVLASLTAAYGLITTFALSFIFPRQRHGRSTRVFIGFLNEIDIGASKSLTLPSGDQMIVSNSGTINAETGSTFLGFSNRCPHLGCRVHWDGAERQFLCPCHQGVFDPSGVAISGPPADAGQQLKPYAIEVDGAAMYAIVENV